MTMLDRLNKQISKQLTRIKKVKIYLGDKYIGKFKATRLNKSEIIIHYNYVHKEKEQFIFNTVTCVDCKTNETIKVRKLDKEYTLYNTDIFNCDWKIGTEIIEE